MKCGCEKRWQGSFFWRNGCDSFRLNYRAQKSWLYSAYIVIKNICSTLYCILYNIYISTLVVVVEITIIHVSVLGTRLDGSVNTIQNIDDNYGNGHPHQIIITSVQAYNLSFVSPFSHAGRAKQCIKHLPRCFQSPFCQVILKKQHYSQAFTILLPSNPSPQSFCCISVAFFLISH